MKLQDAGDKQVMLVGWAAAGITADSGKVALVLRPSREGQELCFVMDPRMASVISAQLAACAAMAKTDGGA